VVIICVLSVYEIRASGATFCHVISNMQLFHLKPSITPGNQKCIGAAPAFRSSAKTRGVFNTHEKKMVDAIVDAMAIVMIITDPTACTIKYLIEDSVVR